MCVGDIGFVSSFCKIENKKVQNTQKGHIDATSAKPEANLEAYLILNALYITYSHFVSTLNSFLQIQKTYNQ